MDVIEGGRMRPTNCPVCGATALPRKLAGFDTFVCGCGFIFAEPGANSSAPDLYDASWSRDVMHPTYQYANGRYVGRNVWKQQSLLDRLQGFQQLNRILDVGCSAAFFLKLAKDRGWKVQGVEVAEWAATFSRKELGVPVFQGLLHAAQFPAGSFDVAFSSHVLEHVEQPKAFIEEMNRVLRPGGALVIIVPTQFRSPSFVLFRRWYGDGPPRHVSFFDRKSLTRLLEGCGFKVIECGHNVELQLLLKQLRRKMAGGRAAPVAADTGGGNAESDREPGLAVRLAKVITNGLGTRLGISDELRVIAVKQER
jgi:SAM-dependent methyltransferase